MAEISVILVSTGENSYLGQAVRMLQIFGKVEILEILVVLPFGHYAIRKQLEQKQKIRLLEKDWSGLAAAYNFGAAAATGRILLFLHDDIVFAPNTLRLLEGVLRQGERIGAVGPFLNRTLYHEQYMEAAEYDRVEDLRLFASSVEQSSSSQEVPFLENPCLLVRREAYEEVDGFSEQYDEVGGEDIDFSFKLRQQGYSLWRAAAYAHHERGTLVQRGKSRDVFFEKHRAELYQRWQLEIGLPESLWANALRPTEVWRDEALTLHTMRSVLLRAPLVSVMIPTFNRPELFIKTVQSALQQTYPCVEIIVCDNSTNDETAHVIQPYLQDTRVRYIRNSEARSKAGNFLPFARLAQGEYLQWCMDDDILLPQKLTKMMDVFLQHPEVVLVTSQRGIIDAEGVFQGRFVDIPSLHGEYGLFSGTDIGRAALLGHANFIGEPSAVLFRRKDLVHHYWRAEVRGYRVISDIVMWLELLEKGDCAIFTNPLSYYRRHGQQEGQQADVLLTSCIEWYRIMQEYYEKRMFLTTQAEYREALLGLQQRCHDAMRPLLEQASTSCVKTYRSVVRELDAFLAKD